MNTLVSLPIVAAVPVVSPSLGNEVAPSNDRAGVFARAQEIVDLLRTRYISEGWKIDEVAAEQALAFCRGFEEDGTEPDGQREAAVAFFRSHGQSLDWIFCGDHRALICKLASYSTRATSLADAELIALSDRCQVAWNAYCDQSMLAANMDDARTSRPLPDVLRWREEDAELGLPVNKSHQLKLRELAWDCEHFVGTLRPAKWPVCTETGSDEDMTIHYRLVAPSTAARARADEIIAAFDKRKKERAPRGLRAAERKADQLYREFISLQDKLAGIRASTVEGMMAKVRCAKAFNGRLEVINLEDCAEAMAFSIFEDLEQLAT